MQGRFLNSGEKPAGIENVGQLVYAKFNADFASEMRRSVRAMLQAWTED